MSTFGSMSKSSRARPAPLAPLVRSAAAIAEASGRSSPSRSSPQAGIPGAIYTPTGDYHGLPARGASVSISNAEEQPCEIAYKFTLVDLNKRSYYLIHDEPDAGSAAHPYLAKFRRHLRKAVVLANLEVCMVRNWQLAGKPFSCVINLLKPSLVDPPDQAADDRCEKENKQALSPIEDLLTRPGGLYQQEHVRAMLGEQIFEAGRALERVSEELASCGTHELPSLAYTFAAYQPAVLDEEVKGSQSPYDARSHTPSIASVQALVSASVSEAKTTAPADLASLAMKLLHTVLSSKSGFAMAGFLLQGACMSGHCELVEKLLDRRVSYIYELDIIRRLRKAWVGYQRYDPLQAGRTGVNAHSIDWLDFKCSCARAVLIANKVIETLVIREDHGMTQSMQVPGAGAPPQHESAGSAPGEPPPDGSATSSSTPAADGCTPPPGGAAQQPRVTFGGIVAAAQAGALSQCATMGGGLLGDDKHVELEPAKWSLVTELFPRPAACKPLALAILHLVLDSKKKIRAAMAAAKEEEAQRAPQQQEPDGALGASIRSSDPPLLRDECASDDDEERIAYEEAERKRREGEARSRRYHKLHLLAVQACHLAVHSTSLSTVGDAITCIRAVRAWPAIDLLMLNDLAAHFPQQCAHLLESIPLSPVDLEDNVLPFGLPLGFTTVAVSDKDSDEFGQGGGSGSTQDSQHFATQNESDVSIEASLLVLGRTWLALLFLFWPAEFKSPTTRQLLRVLSCAVAAFLWQGPGSWAVAAVFSIILLVLGICSRAVVAVFRILYWGIVHRIWSFFAKRFPVLRQLAQRLKGNRIKAGSASTSLGASIKVSPANTADATPDGRDHGDDDEGFTRHLGRGLWQTFFAHGHNTVIDGAVGWGKGSASISCRKLPMPLKFTSHDTPDGLRQLDTSLLEKLLMAPEVQPAVYGSKVLRAIILFKWNYFTKYFIILQFLLHITYMAVFLAYAFTIKDMEPVDGRESGPGANTAGCQLQAPTTLQTALLIVLSIMTVDFTIQEFRQIRHFGLRFFSHTWDILDVCSVALVVASISLHFSCTANVSPLTLRGLASVQIVLLFMRLLYFAMASDKLGSFVRMVLETTYDLMMFFAFLSVVFVGFALAIIISQGTYADEEQTFIKLFTMMYGDFDVNFLSTLDSGALGLDALTRVLASIYMILVTIILLNLLISIISESYERIRENEKWESLRNKALLVVESETQLYQFFLGWLYTTLTPASSARPDGSDQNFNRYMYVIAPENARRAAMGEDDDDDDDDDDGGDDDEDDDGQWNGRLGEMKRHITSQSRSTMDAVRKEMEKVYKSLEKAGAGGDKPPPAAAADSGGAAGGAPTEVTAAAGGVVLDERTVRLIAAEMGALVSQEIGALRMELLAGIAGTAGPHPQPQPQGHGRLSPLAGVEAAIAALPLLPARASANGAAPSSPVARPEAPDVPPAASSASEARSAAAAGRLPAVKEPQGAVAAEGASPGLT